MNTRDLALSVRTLNNLEAAEITTVDQLCSRSADQLVRIRDFGPASLKEVRRELSRIGRHLKDDTGPVRRKVVAAWEDDGSIIMVFDDASVVSCPFGSLPAEVVVAPGRVAGAFKEEA